jgi:hypothetical protein
MSARQVQNESRGSGPRRSVSPAMARWKAWLWAFAGAGSRRSTRVSAGAGAPWLTAAMRPAASMVTRRLSVQPSSARARAAQSVVIGFPA